MMVMISDPHFIRYRTMVSQLAASGLATPGDESDLSGAADLSIVLPAAKLLLQDDPSQHEGLALAMQWLAAHDSMADPAGHVRDIYHPFAMHLCLAAFHRRYETISPSRWSQCEQAISEMMIHLRWIEQYADAAPALADVPVVLWSALAMAEQATLMSRDIDLEMTDSAVAAIVASPGREDCLHEMTNDDSLDTWTYRELVGLHALARLALHRRNNGWAKRVEQVANFHLENTQPDNATNQPWGVFAFLWSSKTRGFAEQQLHDATTHGGGKLLLLPAMLLADAADTLAEFC